MDKHVLERVRSVLCGQLMLLMAQVSQVYCNPTYSLSIQLCHSEQTLL